MLGGHTEILYEDVRLGRRRAARRGGRGLPDRAAPARPGPHPPLHALARRGAPRVRHALRALALPAGQAAACCATSRPCRTGSPTRPREMQAARLMTLHAAWKIDRFGSSAARTRRLADQVLRRQGAARRRRPRAADPRRPRLLDRHAARDALPLRPSRAVRRRRRRGAPRDRSRARSCRRTTRRRTSIPTRVRPDAARGGAAQVRRRARRRRGRPLSSSRARSPSSPAAAPASARRSACGSRATARSVAVLDVNGRRPSSRRSSPAASPSRPT